MTGRQKPPLQRIAEDSKTEYQSASQTFSDMARKAAYGGAGICWLFKAQDFTFPPFIMMSLIFLAAYFTLDLLQYFLPALNFFEIYTSATADTIDIDKLEEDLDKAHLPSVIMFKLKVIALIMTFTFIALELLKRLLHV